jgi:hypothetical protein
LTPQIFSPFGIKHQKGEEKKRNQHLLVISLQVLPINVLTSNSPATSCSSPLTIIIIVVVIGVNMGTSLSVSGGGEVGETSRSLSHPVLLKSLLPISSTSLLLLLLLIIIRII